MVVRSGCDEVGVTLPSLTEDAEEPDVTEPLTGINETLDHLLAETKRLLKAVSDADNEAAMLSTEREKVRTDLESASAEVGTLKGEEQGKNSESAVLAASLQEKKKTFAAVSSRLDSALAPAFPDWKERVVVLGTRFATVCHDFVDDWRKCQKRVEASNAAMSRFAGDLEGSRATLGAKEAAAGEAEKQYVEKRDDLKKLIDDRSKVIGGRPIVEVRTEYRVRWEAADKAWNEAETARSEADKTAAAAASNVISARNTVNSTRTTRDSTERVLVERLQASEISREQAEAAIAKGESWVSVEQSRLDALREAVTTARVTLSERQQAIAIHEANYRPEQIFEEVVAALPNIEARRAKVSEEFVSASAILRHDDQVRIRMAEIKAAFDERRDAARVWSQLDDLIGSADGPSFAALLNR